MPSRPDAQVCVFASHERLRKLVYERIKGSSSFKELNRGAQLAQRLREYVRLRRVERLLIEPHEQLLVELLNNDSNKLQKLYKGQATLAHLDRTLERLGDF
ncbi:hypothetical protein HBI23_258730 [Parastagonospora nodorum]|nr:hypothetical protein HBI23_258730 [Parastagonospora nodorum]KAH6381850.1 hypothetical protein HBI60_260870 [Parastagonospora nodorum]